MQPRKAKQEPDFELPRAFPSSRWESLFIGDRVEVWTAGRKAFLGYVSERSEDGRLLWLTEDGTGGRRLYLLGDDIAVYRAD